MYAVFANVVKDKQLRTGAKVLIVRCNGDAERPIVVGTSTGGRIIQKYVFYKNLTNFRAKWVPPRLQEKAVWEWESKEEAQALADHLSETARPKKGNPWITREPRNNSNS